MDNKGHSALVRKYDDKHKLRESCSEISVVVLKLWIIDTARFAECSL